MSKTCHLSFKKMFFEITKKDVSDKKNIEKIYNDVIKRYSEKGRHYHNINHIYKMCDLLKKHKKKFPGMTYEWIFFAIVFHDIIYKTKKGGNEAASANYFKKIVLKYFDISKNMIGDNVEELVNNSYIVRYISNAIIGTDHTHNSLSVEYTSPEVLLMLDFDLSVLSGTKAEYKEYSDNIRKEYKVFPDKIYNQGRSIVLQGILSKKKIYLSKEFKSLEKKARRNIENEIKKLISKK
jgi:predicted metal-dependent HD superfamily phosphohydrolase